MDNAVAVVGLACRYPGAADAGSLWAALCAGTEGISHWTPEELVAAGADPVLVKRPDFVAARGLVPGARGFDWSMFGYSRADAAGIDPQQRVFLECATAACDDAGLDPARFPGLVGVYGGVDWVATHAANPALTQLIGQDKDFLTSRVAYKLGLRGPAITVQTACSTSLTAVHMAVQSLLGYECDAALAGGASIGAADDRGYIYQEGGILSPDGHCRPFDQQAAGTVPSEGVGVVVLKRLEDALTDGDRIAAVIAGSAVNNDGGDKVGYSAPAIPGQRDVILFAQKAAGIDPADLGHVEAHGTGTRIGDPVEVRALTDVFRMSTDATGSCWLGAVKSNLGHTGAASGVAGLIKTVLMLEHGELVPTLHYTAPNPLLEIESTPFRVCTSHQPWPDDRPRLAAVSSFGVGGTNAHVVVAGAPSRRRPTPRTGIRLLALSAGSPGSLDRYGTDLAEHLAAADVALPAVSRTLAGRRRLGSRRTVVAADPAEAARLLRAPADPGTPRPLDRVAFLFPGQGLLRGAAGSAAYRLLGGFRDSFDEIRDAIRQEYAVDLGPVVTEGGAPAEWFTDTVHQQLGLFALGFALGRQLGDWGVTPLAMLGNSIGEYAAATLAGVWTPAEAAALVCERAGAMRATEPGRMAAVAAPAEEVAERIDPDVDVEIAVVGPERVVVSGGPEAVVELLSDGSLDGLETRLLPNRRAFHSARMEPAADRLLEVVGDVPNRPAQLPLVSNVTGDWADPDAVRDPEYWSEQVRLPVQLDDSLGTVLAAGCDTYLELGPGTSMIGSLRRHRDWVAEHATVPLLGGADEDPERGLLRALGQLWERGLDLDLDGLQEAQAPVRCTLPAAPFDSRDPELAPVAEPVPDDDGPAADPLRAVLARLWCEALGVASARDEDDFFALGGESLMAVHLVARVREHAATVSVADFTRDATFGHLLEMAASAASGPVPGVEVLSPGDGRGTPLFLAADALGTAMTYQVLAGLLGVDRPVYGLQPVATPGTARAARIEQIAAQHVDALVRVQPAGPYTVGGWSFGAVVAHEMACELTRRGHRVEALICLDGGITPGRRPIGLHPTPLRRNIRLQVDAALGRGPVGELVGQAPGLRRLFIANVGAAMRYRPGPMPGPAYVFPADVDERWAQRLQRDLAGSYERVEVCPVAGDHWSMLTEPHVRGLAEQVRRVLAGGSGAGRG